MFYSDWVGYSLRIVSNRGSSRKSRRTYVKSGDVYGALSALVNRETPGKCGNYCWRFDNNSIALIARIMPVCGSGIDTSGCDEVTVLETRLL